MITVLLLLLGLLVVLAITAATGYFVAQEFAYMAVDRSRLNSLAAQGDKGAQRALQVTHRTSFMLSGAQLGITVTGLLVGYVAEPLIGRAFGDILGGVGVPTAVGIGIGTVLALVFATFVQMLFGELFPKNLAIARPEPVARWLARSTNLYLAVFGWLIWFFDQASNVLLRALRIEPVHDVDSTATARDLEHIVAESRQSGDLPRDLSLLLDRAIDFPRRDVEHAMIPRSRVEVVRPDTTVEELREQMATGHSRFPVLDDDERLVGVVHLVDVMTARDAPAGRTAADLARDPVVVPDVMLLPVARQALEDAREQLACVIDEHGGLAGVLTIEDLAEELVGEITDEHDDERPLAVSDGDDAWLFSGDAPLDEVERVIDHDLPENDEVETVAGLVIAEAGALPEVGHGVEVDLPPDAATLVLDEQPAAPRLRFEVLEVEHYVPSAVRVSWVVRPWVEPDAEQTPEHSSDETEVPR